MNYVKCSIFALFGLLAVSCDNAGNKHASENHDVVIMVDRMSGDVLLRKRDSYMSSQYSIDGKIAEDISENGELVLRYVYDKASGEVVVSANKERKSVVSVNVVFK